MAKNFRELEAKLSPESRARVEEKVKEIRKEIAKVSPKTKGAVHGALTLLSLAELPSAKTKGRRALLSVCAGYHAWATFYHWFRERED